MAVSVDMYIPSVSGTTGTYLAVNVGPGGCGVSQFRGVFFAIFPTNSSFVVSSDSRKSAVVHVRTSCCLDAANIFSLSLFRSTSKSRPNNIRGGKCPSIRPSTKNFFDFNEIWYIGRGR